MRMCYTHRRLMSLLAVNLIDEGKLDKVKDVLAKAEKEIPDYNVPHDYQSGSLDLARAYIATDQKEKGQKLVDQLWKKSLQYMQWYCSLDDMRFSSSQRECMINLYIMNQLLDLQDQIDPKISEKKDQQMQGLIQLYHAKGGSFEE